MGKQSAFARLLGLVTILAAPSCATPSETLPQSASASDGVISVGSDVHVSAAYPDLPHYENLAAGDPDNPGRLFACSCVAHQDLAAQGNHCYISFDNGLTWEKSLEFDEGPRNSDPAMTYGRGDTLFYVNEHIPGGAGNRIEIHRSPDGGRTWEMTTTFPFVDRQMIVVDETDGPYAGRIYVSGVSKGYGGPPADVVLYRSLDGGSTFLPLIRPTVEGDGLLGASNPVVLSDGTVAFTTFMFKPGRSPRVLDEGAAATSGNAELTLLRSTDGGESFGPLVTISDSYLDLGASQGGMYAQLAVDPGSPHFADRMYVTFPDLASGRIDVRFAWSDDGGATWSRPVTINDDRPPVDGPGPDHMLPAVAVNRNGVVLVAWYDTRQYPNNDGWEIRAAASLDGGVTFTPSVVVSDEPNVLSDETRWVQDRPGASGGAGSPNHLSARMTLHGWLLSGGHTSGLAAGADGVFHPVWNDHRTGISQLWTAPVTIRGEVTRHGAAELAQLEDVTEALRLVPVSNTTSRDGGTAEVALTVRLMNTSDDTIRGPLKARLVRMSSEIGIPVAVDASNGVEHVGAMWDLDGAVPTGGLPPGSATEAETFTFRLTDLRPLRPEHQQRGFRRGLVQFDLRVFGGTSAQTMPSAQAAAPAAASGPPLGPGEP